MNYISRRWDASLFGDSLKPEGFLFILELCCFCVVVNLGEAGVSVADDDAEVRPWISEGTASHLTPSSLYLSCS